MTQNPLTPSNPTINRLLKSTLKVTGAIGDEHMGGSSPLSLSTLIITKVYRTFAMGPFWARFVLGTFDQANRHQQFV